MMYKPLPHGITVNKSEIDGLGLFATEKIENGKLRDIAPTILQIMGVEIPNEMTGDILIK